MDLRSSRPTHLGVDLLLSRRRSAPWKRGLSRCSPSSRLAGGSGTNRRSREQNVERMTKMGRDRVLGWVVVLDSAGKVCAGGGETRSPAMDGARRSQSSRRSDLLWGWWK
ncbi:unnamed protein product [Linum trigynum]|uniref:Uncharacterized protein n=1 Tax=Linum trigynum TaxID=586398 RepID=A0AAV2EYN1_9ROSI